MNSIIACVQCGQSVLKSPSGFDCIIVKGESHLICCACIPVYGRDKMVRLAPPIDPDDENLRETEDKEPSLQPSATCGSPKLSPRLGARSPISP
jgi:hypothetical protein